MAESSTDFKIQVSYKNSNGDMLNVRGDSPAEVQQFVAQLAGLGVGAQFGGVAVGAAGQVAAPPAPVGAPQQPAPQAPAPAAAAPQQVVWMNGSKKGGGTIKFRPTTNLPTETFKQEVLKKIAASGDPNAGSYVVYDERLGPDGLEAGGESYGVASVKTREGHPAHQAMKKGRGVQQAYFVDFTSAGGVKVTKSQKLEEAEAAVPAAPAAPGVPAPDDDVPF